MNNTVGESEIKLCFNLFVNHMKCNIKELRTYDVPTMTINQIRAEIDVIYMKYILCSSYSVSDSSIGVVAYNHLKKMIDGSNKNTLMHKLENEVKALGLENTFLKQEVNDLKTKMSNVLFPSRGTLESPIQLTPSHSYVLNTTTLPQTPTQLQSTQQKGWFS